MNRELKFRAWDEFNNQMYKPNDKGIYFDEFSYEEMLISGCKGMIFVCDYSPVSGLKLMQFTGLRDKYGVEIYEDDIVKDDNGYIGKVYYDDKSACFLVYLPEECDDANIAYLGGELIPSNEMYEVIGNIYQNKEIIIE